MACCFLPGIALPIRLHVSFLILYTSSAVSCPPHRATHFSFMLPWHATLTSITVLSILSCCPRFSSSLDCELLEVKHCVLSIYHQIDVCCYIAIYSNVCQVLCTVASTGGLEFKRKISLEDLNLSITCQRSQQRSSVILGRQKAPHPSQFTVL